MTKKTLEEFKIEYVTKERIDEMRLNSNITEEKAIEILTRSAEFIYVLIHVQPMNIPSGKTFNIRYKLNINI